MNETEEVVMTKDPSPITLIFLPEAHYEVLALKEHFCTPIEMHFANFKALLPSMFERPLSSSQLVEIGNSISYKLLILYIADSIINTLFGMIHKANFFLSRDVPNPDELRALHHFLIEFKQALDAFPMDVLFYFTSLENGQVFSVPLSSYLQLHSYVLSTLCEDSTDVSHITYAEGKGPFAILLRLLYQIKEKELYALPLQLYSLGRTEIISSDDTEDVDDFDDFTPPPHLRTRYLFFGLPNRQTCP